MKKIFFLILSLILSIFLISEVYAECLNSADDYAVEVVLNKEDIIFNRNLLDNAQNVVILNNKHIFQSAYSSSLAVILEPQSGLTCGYSSGLSVRLQIPVKAEEKNFPYLKFATTSFKSKINISGENYNGWRISCLQGDPVPQCEFKKDNVVISANFVLNKYELIFEIRDNLGGCDGCDGKCISGSGEMRCINKRLKTSIEDILKYSGLANSFDELLLSYRIISVSNVKSSDLVPEIIEDIDLSDAMSAELERLRSEGFLMISNSDINQISLLSRIGAAGNNNRIVYGTLRDGKEGWAYYKDTLFPSLTNLRNCQQFAMSNIPAGKLNFSNEFRISPYYLIPTVATGVVVILFTFLVILARAVHRKKAIVQ